MESGTQGGGGAATTAAGHGVGGTVRELEGLFLVLPTLLSLPLVGLLVNFEMLLMMLL